MKRCGRKSSRGRPTGPSPNQQELTAKGCPLTTRVEEGSSPPLPAGAGAQPVADLGPEAFLGAAARHEADVAGVEDEEFLVLAADEVHGGLGLREGADVVLLARDVEERDLYLGEIDAAPAQDYLAFGQLVLLVELRDPLPERRAWEGRSVVDPLVHREPGLHRLLLEDALPHVDVGSDVVGHGLEHPVARVDEVAGDVAEGVGEQTRVHVLLAREQAVEAHLTLGELYGGGHEDEVLEVLGEQ